MNLGVETALLQSTTITGMAFQHSLMNLGVETLPAFPCQTNKEVVSAFSDESWGGDHKTPPSA